MISTDRQHQLVNSISSLKQVRFITTEQDLSLATRFMLSSLEPIKCMPFSRESVPKFGTLFLIRLKYCYLVHLHINLALVISLQLPPPRLVYKLLAGGKIM